MENELSIDDVANGEGRESKPITWTPAVTFMTHEFVFNRDLTDEEVTQFGEEKLINSGLYAKPENKQQAGEQWQQTASRN